MEITRRQLEEIVIGLLIDQTTRADVQLLINISNRPKCFVYPEEQYIQDHIIPLMTKKKNALIDKHLMNDDTIDIISQGFNYHAYFFKKTLDSFTFDDFKSMLSFIIKQYIKPNYDCDAYEEIIVKTVDLLKKNKENKEYIKCFYERYFQRINVKYKKKVLDLIINQDKDLYEKINKISRSYGVPNVFYYMQKNGYIKKIHITMMNGEGNINTVKYYISTMSSYEFFMSVMIDFNINIDVFDMEITKGSDTQWITIKRSIYGSSLFELLGINENTLEDIIITLIKKKEFTENDVFFLECSKIHKDVVTLYDIWYEDFLIMPFDPMAYFENFNSSILNMLFKEFKKDILLSSNAFLSIISDNSSLCLLNLIIGYDCETKDYFLRNTRPDELPSYYYPSTNVDNEILFGFHNLIHDDYLLNGFYILLASEKIFNKTNVITYNLFVPNLNNDLIEKNITLLLKNKEFFIESKNPIVEQTKHLVLHYLIKRHTVSENVKKKLINLYHDNHQQSLNNLNQLYLYCLMIIAIQNHTHILIGDDSYKIPIKAGLNTILKDGVDIDEFIEYTVDLWEISHNEKLNLLNVILLLNTKNEKAENFIKLVSAEIKNHPHFLMINLPVLLRKYSNDKEFIGAIIHNLIQSKSKLPIDITYDYSKIISVLNQPNNPTTVSTALYIGVYMEVFPSIINRIDELLKQKDFNTDLMFVLHYLEYKAKNLYPLCFFKFSYNKKNCLQNILLHIILHLYCNSYIRREVLREDKKHTKYYKLFMEMRNTKDVFYVSPYYDQFTNDQLIYYSLISSPSFSTFFVNFYADILGDDSSLVIVNDKVDKDSPFLHDENNVKYELSSFVCLQRNHSEIVSYLNYEGHWFSYDNKQYTYLTLEDVKFSMNYKEIWKKRFFYTKKRQHEECSPSDNEVKENQINNLNDVSVSDTNSLVDIKSIITPQARMIFNLALIDNYMAQYLFKHKAHIRIINDNQTILELSNGPKTIEAFTEVIKQILNKNTK